MSIFTVESILDTREPGVIEMLGSAAGISHNVSGTLHLNVQKTVKLKEVSVSFMGEAYVQYDSFIVSTQSDPIKLYQTHFNAIDSPTTFEPGDYSFPFQLSIPSELAAVESTKLSSRLLLWGYDLVTKGVPATTGSNIGSLFQKRKVAHRALTLRKVIVEPSMGAPSRYGASRGESEFKITMWVPKVASITQSWLPLSVLLKPMSGESHRVKEVSAVALQMERIQFDSKDASDNLRGVRRVIPNRIETDPMARDKFRDDSRPTVDTFHTKVISQPCVFYPARQQEPQSRDAPGLVAAAGDAKREEFEMELLPQEMLPTEALPWIQISHAVRFTVVFVDPTKKPLVVKAHFTVGHILSVRDLPSRTWVYDFDDQDAAGASLPEYGADMGQSTLLDSNTSPRGGRYDEEMDATEMPPMYASEGVVPPMYASEGGSATVGR